MLRFSNDITHLSKADMKIINANRDRITKIDGRDLPLFHTIGQKAFQEMPNLREVDFSGCPQLKVIGIESFCKCPNLEMANFANCGHLEHISTQGFGDCKKLRQVNLSGCVLLNWIATGAFAGCGLLQSLNIPEDSNLKEIENNAFLNCEKYNLDVLKCKKLTIIGAGAFKGSSEGIITKRQATEMIAGRFVNNKEFFKEVSIVNAGKYYGTQVKNFCKHIFSEERTDVYDEITITEVNKNLVKAERTSYKAMQKENRKNQIKKQTKYNPTQKQINVKVKGKNGKTP